MAIRVHTLSDSLSDRRLPCPSETAQSKDGRLLEVLSSRLDLIQDSPPRAPEAASAITMLVHGAASATTAVEH